MHFLERSFVLLKFDFLNFFLTVQLTISRYFKAFRRTGDKPLPTRITIQFNNACDTCIQRYGLSRQVVVHDRETKHDILRTEPGKWVDRKEYPVSVDIYIYICNYINIYIYAIDVNIVYAIELGPHCFKWWSVALTPRIENPGQNITYHAVIWTGIDWLSWQMHANVISTKRDNFMSWTCIWKCRLWKWRPCYSGLNIPIAPDLGTQLWSIVLGWGLLSQFPPSVVFRIFKHYQNICELLKITFIFDMCHHSGVTIAELRWHLSNINVIQII